MGQENVSQIDRMTASDGDDKVHYNTVRCFAQMVDEVDNDAKLITAQKAILQ